jgi:hypothetical protein
MKRNKKKDFSVQGEKPAVRMRKYAGLLIRNDKETIL